MARCGFKALGHGEGWFDPDDCVFACEGTARRSRGYETWTEAIYRTRRGEWIKAWIYPKRRAFLQVDLGHAAKWLADQGRELPECLCADLDRGRRPPAPPAKPPVPSPTPQAASPDTPRPDNPDGVTSPAHEERNRGVTPGATEEEHAKLKEPSENAIKCYIIKFLTGNNLTQEEIGLQVYGKENRQGQVSRDLSDAKAWVKAGNILPEIGPLKQRR